MTEPSRRHAAAAGSRVAVADPSGGYEFEQAVRRLVNFGVAALARALGGTPDEVLELRCECAQCLCTSRVRVRLGDYGDGSSGLLLDHRHRAEERPLQSKRPWQA